jgi:hypothetical protein
MPQVMGSHIVRPFSLASVKAGTPDLGVEVLRSHGIDGCSAPASTGE